MDTSCAHMVPHTGLYGLIRPNGRAGGSLPTEESRPRVPLHEQDRVRRRAVELGHALVPLHGAPARLALRDHGLPLELPRAARLQPGLRLQPRDLSQERVEISLRSAKKCRQHSQKTGVAKQSNFPPQSLGGISH